MANTTIPSELIADGAITSAKLDTNIAVGGTLNVSGAFTSLGIDDNADATAITIDSSENVGIGVTPSVWSQGRAMEVFQSGFGIWNGTSSIYSIANAYYDSSFKYANTGAQASHYYQFQGAHVWSTAPSGTAGNTISFTQAMTLDASGNLLVGQNSSAVPGSGNTVTGISIAGQYDAITISRADAQGLIVNRNSDGKIIEINKDGASVGSIGTGLSSLAIGKGNTQLMFWDAQSGIFPSNGTTVTDNSIDFGNPNYRFKDLYLSGGVVFNVAGGTGTSTSGKLDDYEEGTWTGTLKGATEPGTLITATGFYTKIGRMVNYTLAYENVDTSGYAGAISVDGLPFTNNGTRSAGAIGTYYMATWNTATELYTLIEVSQTTITLQSARSSDTWAQPTHLGTSQSFMWLQGTYITNS